ncbi:DNA-methyltransferase [Metaclostridioides mangenotii]|uniref:Methyltransferase n=1 Tax=Metaclostridioides mangenotii TaxID=1540 RepID=A0ABS4E9Q4_9FIRM|nr:site-specific DNA-methyltransferase [Clostridioides mangenotii]MBP1854677.1 site-specific DNA-methyltransferase (adenine-specific) [Clostridioides mangenotii]
MLKINRIYNMDCLEGMRRIENKSIDMILCDLPYGQTKNHWDIPIPLDLLWKHYKRIIKDNGAIVLFASGMFTAELMQSNKEMWRYNLVWDKVLTTGFLDANRRPLRRHEDICIFYKQQPSYSPQKTIGNVNHSMGYSTKYRTNNNFGEFEFKDNREELGVLKHPTSILKFPKNHPSKMQHPTEKPIPLFRWLIESFSKEGDLILDNCIGKGTTAEACIELGNRNFIGFENDIDMFNIANKNIRNVQRKLII